MGPELEKIIASLLPLLRQFVGGRHAVCLGGSMAKGQADPYSDVDLYLFADEALPPEARKALVALTPGQNGAIHAASDFKTCWWGSTTDFEHSGFKIESSIRHAGRVDQVLADCLAGKIETVDTAWNPHGFYNYVWLADLHDARILEDPAGMVAGWKKALSPYPPKLKAAQLEWHLPKAKFWLDNFHYDSAIKRGDVYYSNGIVQSTLHHLIHYLFALNETYYSGDKRNVEAADALPLRPRDFAARARQLLLAPELPEQQELLRALVTDAERLH